MLASLPVPELSAVPLRIELHPCEQQWEIWRKKPNVDKVFEELNPSSPFPSLSHLKAENSYWARHTLSFPYLKPVPKYHREIMLSERRPRSRFPLRDSAASLFNSAQKQLPPNTECTWTGAVNPRHLVTRMILGNWKEFRGKQQQNPSRAGKGSASKGSFKTLNMYNLTKRGLKRDMLTSYTSLKAESTEGREELFSKMRRGLERSDGSEKQK